MTRDEANWQFQREVMNALRRAKANGASFSFVAGFLAGVGAELLPLVRDCDARAEGTAYVVERLGVKVAL